jgi:putative flippase GtrA
MPGVSKTKSRIRHVGKFGLVGILNTLIDFGIFNLAGKYLLLPAVQANIVSTTVAMIFSFFVNRQVVFKDHEKSIWHHAAGFLIITAVGLYIIQTGVIYLLAHVWRAPLEAATHIVRGLGIQIFSDEFYVRNGAKAIGTVFSLMWNYVLYKKVVFR